VGVLMQPSDEKLSRRELLRGVWAKQDVYPVIDGEKCTGCGLCALGCEPGALKVAPDDDNDAYRIVFAHALCTACEKCETACPEKCLTLEKAVEDDKSGSWVVVFEDEMTRCSECGVSMFPAAMVGHLQKKTRAAGTMEIPFDLCPACRMKRQIVSDALH
jgi:ferredoxin